MCYNYNIGFEEEDEDDYSNAIDEAMRAEYISHLRNIVLTVCQYEIEVIEAILNNHPTPYLEPWNLMYLEGFIGEIERFFGKIHRWFRTYDRNLCFEILADYRVLRCKYNEDIKNII